MKKYFSILAFLLICFVFSQEKKIEFTKELKYEVNTLNNTINNVSILGNTNGEFLTSISINNWPYTFYSDKLGMTPSKINLNNQLSFSFINNYHFFHINDFDSNNVSEISVKNLNTTETILGNSCNNYVLPFTYGDYEYENPEGYEKNLKICIDEKNSINNFPVFTGILNLMSGIKISNSNLKGLVLKVGPEENYNEYYTILKSSKDTKDFVYFDHKKALMTQQKKKDSLIAEYNNVDKVSTAAIEDSAMAEVYDLEDYENIKYESTYKKLPESVNYAISDISNEKMWEILPRHCRNFEKEIPNLDDKEFASHIKNLTGQTCDLYLTQTSNNSVAIKITIDEIRREFLYINKNKNKLNKTDRTKVDNYLENLD